MDASFSRKLAAGTLALALAAAALPVWLARDRPWMGPDEVRLAALLGGGPFLVVALLAAAATVLQRRRGVDLSRALAVLLGMLLALVLCWLPWILLVSSARTWL